MPTILTHAVVGVGLGRVFTPRRMPVSFWLTAAGLAMLPDLDVLAFRLGIPYHAALGHRGFSHSLCFALLAGLAAATLTYRRFGCRWPDLLGFFFVVTASHGILDAFTNGGLGIAFFLPLDDRRYFFPWTPITVSPLGAYALTPQGSRLLRQAVLSELLWVWVPTAVLVAGVEVVRRLRAGR
jgi:inner membrane protein